jgi:hypothetical protein
MRPDVGAAVNVIRRRNTRHDRQPVSFFAAYLPDADLHRADLTGADLSYTVLNKVITGADLTFADLAGANLTRADLTGADLTGADLTRADLTGAKLKRAILTEADLTDAIRPPKEALPEFSQRDTEVPEGWQRDDHSYRLKRADTSSGGTATD